MKNAYTPLVVERGKSPFGVDFSQYCSPAYPGSMSLPPVICNTFTGRVWEGLQLEQMRPGFVTAVEIGMGRLDAPARIPAGSHCAPRVTCNGLPVIERPGAIYPREVSRS